MARRQRPSVEDVPISERDDNDEDDDHQREMEHLDHLKRRKIDFRWKRIEIKTKPFAANLASTAVNTT